MLILGIESSCDETAAAVVEDGRRVRSNVIASQHDLHAEYGGVVPELASRAHAEKILPIVRASLAEAGLTLDRIDAVAVGHRPGLIGSLLVGVAAAKALAWALGKPLIGVDHIHAHLYAGMLEERDADSPAHLSTSSPAQSPSPSHRFTVSSPFPSLGLVVSGGHTALYRCDSPIDLARFGSTIDDAMGEAFDKAATILGLPYPGGPNLDRLAQRPGADDRAHDFPVSRLGPESLDFSFSGLKTSLLYAVRGKPLPGGAFERDHAWLSDASKADFAASFQRAAVKAVTIKLGRALERVNADLAAAGRPACRALLAGGGVTANTRLRAELGAFAAKHDLELRLPAMPYCVDNAAMIAGLGYHLLAAGRASGLDLQAVPTTAA
jgi:N6-L-threonylcarbamoyladenine synthase